MYMFQEGVSGRTFKKYLAENELLFYNDHCIFPNAKRQHSW